MAAYNIKTPTVDWSSFMKRDFSKENSLGALADAFKVVGETADGYGETADKKLINSYANETDASKIDNTPFYSQDNALRAKSLVEQNNIKAFQEDQRKRTDELNARDDAQYAINQYTKEAIGDIWNMDKTAYNAKYANAGGIDNTAIQNAWNQKEDRSNNLVDRERKIELDNLQRQNIQNTMNQNQSKYNYEVKEREQKKIDNNFVMAIENGLIPDDKMGEYSTKVSPGVYSGIVKQKQANTLISKYPDFNTLTKSEEWASVPFDVKNTVAKIDYFNKKGKETSVNDQIKLEEINNNKKDLTRVQEEYKKAYGVDMPISEQSKFIYKGEVPEKLKDKAAKSKDLTDATATKIRNMVVGLEDMQRFTDSYKSEFTGPLDAFSGMVSDGIGAYAGGGDEAKFRSQLPLIVGPIVKAIYGGNASDSDKKSVENAMPTFRDNEQSWKSKMGAFYEKSRDSFNTNINILKEQGVDTSAYEAEYNKIVPSIFGKDVVNKKEVKVIGKNIYNDSENTLVGNLNATNTNNKTVVRKGLAPDGRTVVKYSDGSIEYGN